jgi:hypothetical protein
MDEIPVPRNTTPEPLLTIEEIRERLKPYYAEKLAGTYEDRWRKALSSKIACFEQLLEAQKASGNEELELIG